MYICFHHPTLGAIAVDTTGRSRIDTTSPQIFQKKVDKHPSLEQNYPMCMNIRFVTAVALAIEGLKSSAPFSAYNVTQKLRQQVNGGEVVFSDRSPETIDGQQTYRVDHEEVRSVVHELFTNKVVYGLQRRDNGRWIEYHVVDTSTPAVPVQASTPMPTPQPAVIPTPAPSNVGLLPKIKAYLEGRKGEQVTMKEVQSRFKGVDKRCNEFGVLITNLGYTLNTGGTPSQWSCVP